VPSKGSSQLKSKTRSCSVHDCNVGVVDGASDEVDVEISKNRELKRSRILIGIGKAGVGEVVEITLREQTLTMPEVTVI